MLLQLTVILLILLIVPQICKLIRIPTMVGIILSGILFGQYGIGLIQPSEVIDTISKAGMIYIMFLAGIEIDMNEFRRTRSRSVVFGLYTFFVPFVLGVITSFFFLNFSLTTSLLLGAMYGSHTLITYPTVSRYGLQKQNAVNLTVGGTMLAITISLLFMGGISSSLHTDNTLQYWLKTIGFIVLFIVVVLWIFPRLASWFIKRNNDTTAEFILIITLVTVAAYITEIAGFEGILGAFIAGLALNRRIPNLSPLMGRINFAGNAIFIPIFLLSVGMMIDLRILTEGYFTILVAACMVLTKLLSKWFAAFLAQRTWQLDGQDRQLIFGLTSASAAGTLAIATIGFDLNIFSIDVLNGAVILILISTFVASFSTDRAAKKISAQELFSDKQSAFSLHTLIPISNNITNQHLVDMALFTTPDKQFADFTALAVATKLEEEPVAQELLRQTEQIFAASDCAVDTQFQAAANIANGIAQIAKERNINKIVAGIPTNEQTYGYVVSQLLSSVGTTLMLYRQHQPLSTVECLRIAIPVNAEKESGFLSLFEQLRVLATQTGARVVFYANETTQLVLKTLCNRPHKRLPALFIEMQDWEDSLMLAKDMQINDMAVFVQARHSTRSYNPLFTALPGLLNRFFGNYNTLIMYPDQTGIETLQIFYEDKNIISRIGLTARIKKCLLKIYQHRQTIN